MAKQHDILLESGTNEIEIFEFIIGNQSFGVNALKISELTQFKSLRITKLPQANDSLYGTALFRDKVVPLIDIGKYLEIKREENIQPERQVVLFCEYNRRVYGFLIDKIVSIHRLNWNQIQPPHKSLSDNVVTAFTIVNGKEVLILDFETITFSIIGEEIFSAIKENPEETQLEKRKKVKLFIADDSSVIRKKVKSLLDISGYVSATYFENGQQVFDEVIRLNQDCVLNEKPITDYIDFILTDIEMPAMDGLTLCKNIKKELPKLPVVVMSSLVNDQIAEKCKSVHADFALSKNDMAEAPKIIDKFCADILNK